MNYEKIYYYSKGLMFVCCAIIEGVCKLITKALGSLLKEPVPEMSRTRFYVRSNKIDYEVLPMHKSLFSMAKYDKNSDVSYRGKKADKKQEE